MLRENDLFLARLQEMSTNSNEYYRRYNFQAVADISGNFRKISGNIKFPENLQPYTHHTSSGKFTVHCKALLLGLRWLNVSNYA